MEKFIIEVRVEEEGVPAWEQEVVKIYSQSAQQVAVWVLEERPFKSIVKQNPYYAVKSAEREKGEAVKQAIIEKG